MEFEKRRARERQATSTGGIAPQLSADRREADPGRVSEKLAEKAGVGRRSVERAIKVREEGIAEIDENLCRAELTPTQEAEHLARRKQVWEAMRASAAVSEQLVPKLSTRGRESEGRPEGFASSTSAATGKSKQDINRAIRRVAEVCQEARDLIQGTKILSQRLGTLADSRSRIGEGLA